MSNLLKSNFVHFLPDSRLIKVDASDSRIINNASEFMETAQDGIDKELKLLLHKRDAKQRRTEQQIIDEANQDAENIIQEAKVQAEKLKALALEEGKAEGISEGYREGVVQANKVITKAEEQLQTNQKRYEEQISRLEPHFAEVVINVINKVTGQLLEEKKDIIIHLINMGMRDINPSNRRFLVRVSADDYDYVMEHAEKVDGYLNPANRVEFCLDKQLQSGDCIIETESGLVNSSIDVQLQGIISDLRLLAGM